MASAVRNCWCAAAAAAAATEADEALVEDDDGVLWVFWSQGRLAAMDSVGE